MLDFLQRKCAIPPEKFYIHFNLSGNTVSNTIPIAIYHALADDQIKKGSIVAVLGFGVGLSWAGCITRF